MSYIYIIKATKPYIYNNKSIQKVFKYVPLMHNTRCPNTLQPHLGPSQDARAKEQRIAKKTPQQWQSQLFSRQNPHSISDKNLKNIHIRVYQKSIVLTSYSIRIKTIIEIKASHAGEKNAAPQHLTCN